MKQMVAFQLQFIYFLGQDQYRHAQMEPFKVINIYCVKYLEITLKIKFY